MSALARFTSLDPRPGLAAVRIARVLVMCVLAMRVLVARFGLGRPGARGSSAGVLRRRARGLVLRSVLMALVAALLAAGGLAVASGLFAPRPASGQALSAPAPAPRWVEIRRPLALYDLAGTEFSKLPASYRARRREPDGAREDVMTFGSLGDAKPYLQVSLLRAGPGSSEDADAGSADGLADGLARLAGVRGLTATRVRPAAPVNTRLGRFEAADLLLWDGGGTSTPCLGFRGDGGTPLRVAGFACGVPGRPMGRAALACAIDRIDLVSAGDDGALRAVFVAAERRGGAGSTCLGGPSLAAVGFGTRGLGWLDPGAELPRLRGLFEATVRRPSGDAEGQNTDPSR